MTDEYMRDHDHGAHRDGPCPGCESEANKHSAVAYPQRIQGEFYEAKYAKGSWWVRRMDGGAWFETFIGSISAERVIPRLDEAARHFAAAERSRFSAELDEIVAAIHDSFGDTEPPPSSISGQVLALAHRLRTERTGA